MPLRMMVTPLSLYMLDPTVYDNIHLPTRPTNPTDYPDLYVQGFDLDRSILVENLLMELGEMDVIYTDPAFMKYAVERWSAKELPTWQELYNTLFYKYNPLWNKDGTVKETASELRDLSTETTYRRTRSLEEDIEGTTENQRISSDTRLNTGTVQDAGTSSENTTHGGNVTTAGSSVTDNKVSSFNSSAYENKDKSDSTNSQTVTDASTVAVSGTDGNTRTDNLREETDGSVTDNGSSSQGRDLTEEETVTDTDTDSGSVEHTLERSEQGNIGVTMTTQLIEAQRALVKLNFYDFIIDSFKKRFCIMVY